jgi:hypothetical protein
MAPLLQIGLLVLFAIVSNDSKQTYLSTLGKYTYGMYF